MAAVTSRLDVPDHQPSDIVVSQLIWRVLGPREPRRPRAIADWAGLHGPTEVEAVLAARHGVSDRTLQLWRRQIRDHAETRLNTPDRLRTQLARPTAAGEDHRARQRQAWLFGIAVAGGPPVVPVRRWSEKERGYARIIRRILAAVNPLTAEQIVGAIRRTHRNRHAPAAAIVTLLWSHPHFTVEPNHKSWLVRPVTQQAARPLDQRLLAAAAAAGGGTFTRSEITALCVQAGYTPLSAIQTVQTHPLLVHDGPNRWSIMHAVRVR